MKIRQETAADHGQVSALIASAFAGAEHADGNEQGLVTALRQGDAFVPELSLVAEEAGEIVGHILFTKAMVGQMEVLALAPLSVLPSRQGQGIGLALMEAGHRIARKLGYPYALVLGSETYYPKAGYGPAVALGVEVPPGMPRENFMAIRLRQGADPLRGPVVYAREFGL